MNKIYCPSCGGATEYTITKPKFCGSCGSSFIIASENVKAKSLPAKKSRIRQYAQENIEEDNEDEVLEEEVIAPQKLSVSIEKQEVVKESLGDLIKNSENCGAPLGIRKKPRKISRKRAMEQWQRENGPVRESKEIN